MSQETAQKEEQVNGHVEQPAGQDEKAEAKPQVEDKEGAKEEGETTENGDGKDAEAKDAAAEGAGADAAEGDATATPKVEVQGEDAPLTKILEQLDQLSEAEQQVIKENLERISTYPKEMPLSQSWTLHFSDTSGASKHSSAAATKDAYTEGINPVFHATTVPGLCGQLKAFKKAVRHKRAKPTDPDGLGLNRPGMNLHFFRTGISPTWEDPYNEKGGRLTISPPAALFDPIYERLVLLLAGSSLELSTSSLLATEGPSPVSKRPPTPGPCPEGMIMGVVASRRARGDRIELWVGGKAKKEPTPGDWIDRLKEVLADQLEMPELRTSKYKKHF
ncbi:hypothetical protein JCM11491_005342 [Sporobolomyces phaffii]